MMEFEPAYFEEFLSYLAVKDLLVSSLCAVELRSKGYNPGESILIAQAADRLEKFLGNPDYQQVSMLMEASGWSREKVLAFLEKVLAFSKHYGRPKVIYLNREEALDTSYIVVEWLPERVDDDMLQRVRESRGFRTDRKIRFEDVVMEARKFLAEYFRD